MIINQRVTIAAGTPVQLATAPIWVRSLFIQMRHGGSGYGTVFNLSAPNLQGVTPSVNTGSHVAAELPAAPTLGPGGSWSYPDNERGYNLQWIWIDGSNSGDTVTVSYDQKM